MATVRIIRHLGWHGMDDNRCHDGVITVVADFDGAGKVYIGLAFCSPKDHFSRKRGVALALSRLDIHPLICPTLTDDNIAVSMIVRSLGYDGLNRCTTKGAGFHIWKEIIPSWFKRLAKQWKYIS